ncbi:uncharacterized protein RCC_08805 [Ramularia collo-cygni]|uniref:Uncharacterized protein n=1 Tax=Ramularia collo-cygni TaxID=112498 RepID=A0A2D3VBP1_9PEZI|nr:uncharacterized protein RCC_08805 [Ramularia collo-cygni]CZT23095.1 uncharacterized protein RCC_08805 [Ramularia collo-cygni]
MTTLRQVNSTALTKSPKAPKTTLTILQKPRRNPAQAPDQDPDDDQTPSPSPPPLPPNPLARFDTMPAEMLNKIIDDVIREGPRDMNEIVMRNPAAPLPPGMTLTTVLSPPYVNMTIPKNHPMIKTSRLFRSAFMAKYYFNRNFSIRIEHQDPTAVVFNQYLDSFEGSLPFIRMLKANVAVTSAGLYGRMMLTMFAGTIRARVSDHLIPAVLPAGMQEWEYVRDIALPWVQTLRTRIVAERVAIVADIGAPTDGWFVFRESPNRYTSGPV